MQSQSMKNAAHGDAGSLRRGHHSRGGRGGGRVSFAACPGTRATGEDRAGQPSEGESWPLLPGQAGGQSGRFQPAIAGRWSRSEAAGIRERGPAGHRLWDEMVFDCIELKCENAKFDCMFCNNSWRANKTAAGSLRRPFAIVSAILAERPQLAATARPLRASLAATRSTSASATVRASATHLSSITLRP